MKIDFEKFISSLKTQLTFTREGTVKNKKGLPASKQYINQLVQDGRLPILEIDGVIFIVSDPQIAEEIKAFEEKKNKRLKKSNKDPEKQG